MYIGYFHNSRMITFAFNTYWNQTIVEYKLSDEKDFSQMKRRFQPFIDVFCQQLNITIVVGF